ncbi:unnamed protein product [Pieris macdunnoughi]|uniref:Mutator-like transposase domain-containing protein n=1 Tax=Pieris macdunnoughi TaxID=345717 RepID=A0A821XLK2_9NEOP|nr:unnamed protein product [Pieris macdunnoughi]
MSDCFICKKPLGDIKVRTVKARRVKTSLLERARFKNDLDNELFLQSVSVVTVHIPCYHYYSDGRTDNEVRRLSSSSSSSSVSENLDTDFDFSNQIYLRRGIPGSEIFIYLEELVLKNGIPLVEVRADCFWSARSYGDNYKALSGASVIIGRKFGEVLYVEVNNKYCLVCVRKQKRSRGKTTRLLQKLRWPILRDGI